jgi:YD repeat-containing protein
LPPGGEPTRFSYEGGLLRSMHAPGGNVIRLEYDGQGGVSRVFTGAGTELRLTRDPLGRVVEIENPRGGVRRRHYDAEGNVVRIEEPHGVVRRLAYDNEGNLVRAQDGLRDVSFAFGGYNRLRERREAGTTVRYHHDAEGWLHAVENEAGERYERALDPRGLTSARRGFDGSLLRFEIDIAGRVEKVARASGQTTSLTYDPAGRLTIRPGASPA